MTSKQQQFIKDRLGVPKDGVPNVISSDMAMALLNCASGLTREVTQRLKVRCHDGKLMSLYMWAGAVIEEDGCGLMYGEWD